MIRLFGAIIIVFACATVGWQERRRLKNRVQKLEEAECIARLIRLCVCVRREPLPQLLEQMERAFPGRFRQVADTFSFLREVSFGEYWRACMGTEGFQPEAADPLCDAVNAISAGQIPERALDICDGMLHQRKIQARQLEQEKGRIYMAFGTAGGCLLALILL